MAAIMAHVRALTTHEAEYDEYDDQEVFVSLEDTPIVLADIRAALPQLGEILTARWPNITGVEIINRRITRRRNPHDPTQVLANAVLCIAVYFCTRPVTRPVQIFLEEAARAVAKKVGDSVGDDIVEIKEGIKIWIMAHAPSALKPTPIRKRLPQVAISRRAKKKVLRKRPHRN